MISKLLNALSLSALLTLMPLSSLLRGPQEARAQSSLRPYVVLVNGYQDCCAWYMNDLIQELQSMDATIDIRRVPWDSFQDGANQRSNTSSDSQFISEGVSFIRQLDPDRPIIMIGHSYGGDSAIKLASRVTDREILFLGVIDPVAGGGLRAPVTNYTVTDNVQYFFNRWQQNGLDGIDCLDIIPGAPTPRNCVPLDSRISGNVNKCDATICDQQEQSIARNVDYSPTRISCEAHEVTCDGWTTPGVSCEIVNFLPRCTTHSGSNGTKQKRLFHADMAQDVYIQRQIVEKVTALLEQEEAGFIDKVEGGSATIIISEDGSYVEVIDEGIYRSPDGSFVSVNNNGALCNFESPAHFEFLSGDYNAVQSASDQAIETLRNDGPCPVILPTGAYRLVDGRIINSNGSAFCRYVSYEHYANQDGRAIKQIEGTIPLFAMDNHFDCAQ